MNTVTVTPTYTELFRPIKQDGHKVYRNEKTGRLELADWSGRLPSQTDDGALSIDPSVKIELVVYANKLVAIVPVICERDGRGACVWTSFETARAIKQHGEVTFVHSQELTLLLGQVAALGAAQ